MNSRKTTILIVVFFFLFSLRVVTWFQYPNVLISGDSRPPLIQEAFSKRVTYTWDETDWGMPSVYAPRILVPSNFFISVFQILGANLYSAQMAALVLMFFFSSTFMFMFTKRITDNNIVASFVAAIFLTSNLYLIADRESTAIAFLDESLVIFPCLITFLEGVRRKSHIFIALSGVLFVLTYGAFPNFRIVLLCLIALTVSLLFIFLKKGISFRYRRENAKKPEGFYVDANRIYRGLKYIPTFVFAALSASVWIIALILANLGALFQAYGQIAVSQNVLNLQLQDALRLITKWGFYSSYMNHPYVPYASVYLQNPIMIFLSYLPPILAFASLLISKSRKLKIYFCVTAVFFWVLSAAFNPFFSQLYFSLSSSIPFMVAFRESAQWTFFTIIFFGILIGITTSALFNSPKRRLVKAFILSLVIVIFIASAYPITTGDITTNYLQTNVKGAYFPNSYAELNNALSNEYWTLLLPERGTYETYNFSGIPLGSGNPYPLIFSKPVITGLGTEYMQSNNSGLLNKVYESMMTTQEDNVAPKGNTSASSIEKEGFEPSKAVDDNYSTRWSSERSLPQWYEIDWNQTQELSSIKIFFENAYANDYTLQTWNNTGWINQASVENNTSTVTEYEFPQLVATTKLRINFTEALAFNNVSIWEIQVYAQETETAPKFLGLLGIKYLVIEKDLIGGNYSKVSDIRINQSQDFVPTNYWNELTLYTNTYALQKLYPADNVINVTTVDDVFQNAREQNWSTLQHSVLLNSTSANTTNNALIEPKNFEWNENSPTSYAAKVQSNGPFILSFLESYDTNWKLTVNGNTISEDKHFQVNGFANAWLIDSTGDLTITLQYQPQTIFLESVIASIILPLLLFAFLCRKDLKKIGDLIRRKNKPSQNSTKSV